MPLQGMLVADAEARIRHHQNRDLIGVPVGQIVGQMNAIRPVKDIIDTLVSDAEKSIARIGQLMAR